MHSSIRHAGAAATQQALNCMAIMFIQSSFEHFYKYFYKIFQLFIIKLFIPFGCTNYYYLYSCFPSIIKLWNNLDSFLYSALFFL